MTKGSDKNSKKKEPEENIQKLFEESYPNNIHFNGKIIGKGGFNTIHSVTIQNSIIGAGKILQKNNTKNHKKDEIYFSSVIKGKNVIKKLAGFDAGNGINDYHLVVMESAQLSDLHKLFYYIKDKNLLNTLYTSFKNSENLLRFFAKQIVQGLATIRKYGFAHMDLKPKNLLVTYDLGVRFSDYSISLDPQNEGEKIEKPGGTNGYMPPEYYEKQFLDKRHIDKYDIYSLGASLYNLKTGDIFLDIDNKLARDKKKYKARYQYERSMKKLDSLANDGNTSKEFVDLLKQTMKYNPEDRINFEDLYRNKWINKYSEELEKIVEHNEADEEKAIMELTKSDTLLKFYEKEKNHANKQKFIVSGKKKKYKRVLERR